MVKVGLIAPNNSADFLEDARRITRGMDIELVVGHGHFAQGVMSARQMLQDNPDIEVFMSRCNTAIFLRKNFDLPVVDLTLTDFDFVKAISALKEKRGPILLIQFVNGPAIYDTEAMSRVCGVEVKGVLLDMVQDNDYNLIAEQMGCQRVITSIAVVAEACQRGGKEAIIVPFPDSEIKRAFERAIQLVRVRESDRRRIDRFKETLDSFKEAFVATDETGEITVLNRAFASILGVPSDTILGLHIEAAKHRYPFLSAVFTAEDEDIIEYQGEKYSITLMDTLAPDLVGDLRRVSSVPDIQKKEGAIRRKLLEGESFRAKNTFDDILSECAAMMALKTRARLYAHTASNILILGESGTGKELLAQSIHNASTFSAGPFVAINCAALPEALLESELFGYEEGAFTGARRGGKTGLMELSHEGTLFLDEIGLMPRALQAKILRSIQERQICRLGGNRLIPIHNRLICATNRDLAEDVRQGLFREDLYYRMDVLSLTIPPLRERGADIIRLGERLLESKSRELRRTIRARPGLLGCLQEYDWPGNVRQLEAFIERLVALTDGESVDPSLLHQLLAELPTGMNRRRDDGDADSPPAQEAPHGHPLRREEFVVTVGTIEEIEEQVIREAFQRCHGDISALKQLLGISRTTLWRKLKLYGLGDTETAHNE